MLLFTNLLNVGIDIRVVLCTSVPSVIVRNANTSKLEAYTLVYKFYCLRLFVVVYKLVNVGFDIRVVLCTSIPSLIVRNTNTSKLEAYTLVYKF